MLSRPEGRLFQIKTGMKASYTNFSDTTHSAVTLWPFAPSAKNRGAPISGRPAVLT